jgi:MtN3 and saliva related transmembrane protein
MDLTTTLGLVAGSLTTIAYFPQVIKTWRSRSADGMSWSMLIILCMGILLWLVYGIYVGDTPVILANLFTLVFSSAILSMKVRYEAVPKIKAKREAIAPIGKGTNLIPAATPSDLTMATFHTEFTFSSPEPESSSRVA